MARVSRKIWDDARKSPKNCLAILHAILYELQPLDLMHHHDRNILRFFTKDFINALFPSIRTTLPAIWEFLQRRSRKQWIGFICLIGYWKLLVFLHRTLDAGPSFLILTALVLIFTIGLGDDSNHGQEHLSAYSVFNRGFRNMMGGVDANALLQQHVGGGLVPPAAAAAAAGRGGGHDDDLPIDQNNPAVRQRQHIQHQRDQQRILQQQRDRQSLLHQQQQQDELNEENPLLQGARKSNKKNRRKRNIELRREMQQQREAAAAMGFAGDGGGDHGHVNIDLQQRDQVAMNRLVEYQILQQEEED